MHRTRRKSNGEPLRVARRSNGACVAECSRLVCTDNTRNTEKQAAKANTHADDDASDGEDDGDGRKKGKGRKTEVTPNAWTKIMRKQDQNIATRRTECELLGTFHNRACSVAVSYKPPMLVTRVRLSACARLVLVFQPTSPSACEVHGRCQGERTSR